MQTAIEKQYDRIWRKTRSNFKEAMKNVFEDMKDFCFWEHFNVKKKFFDVVLFTIMFMLFLPRESKNNWCSRTDTLHEHELVLLHLILLHFSRLILY